MKMCMRFAVIILGFVFAAFPLSAQEEEPAAEEAPSPAGDDEEYPFIESDEGITVFARPETNPAVPVSDAYGSHNEVSEARIREQGSLDLLDSLRNVPGLMFGKRNIVGTNTGTSLYIRGRGASHPSLDTAASFDGVPRSGMIFGQSLADGIPVYAAESVEVYKAPQPSSFATGYGLVNVRPKYMRAEGMEFQAGFSAGSFGTFADNEAFGWKSGAFDVYAARSWVVTDGHSDHSAAHQQSYYVNTGFQINKWWAVRALANSVEAETERPYYKRQAKTAVLPTYDTETAFFTLTLNNAFDNAAGFLKVYHNDTSFKMFQESGKTDDWSEQAMTASGVKAKETFFLWEGNEIIAGADLDKARLDNFDHNTGTTVTGTGTPTDPITAVTDNTTVIYDFPDMTLFSPYLAASQYVGARDGFHVLPSAGVRGYVHTVWANGFAPQAGLVLGYGNTDLRLNYAWGVVYPSPGNILELARDPAALGAADLKNVKPETVYHYEAGLSHAWPGLFTLGGAVFYDDGRDRIISATGGAGPVNDVSSASYYRIRGVEASASLTPVEGLEVFAGGTWLAAKAKGQNGKEVTKLPYTPELSASAGLSWTLFGHIRLSGDYQYLRGVYTGDLMKTQGSFSDPSIIAKLDDQHLVNLRLACSFDYEPWNIARGEVFFSLNNLLNRKYEYYLIYEMPGIAFMAGADIKFR
ncbi:MAG: TonB-dependent receptor plug domain-containing protein [Spirochaetia bacterium]|nr:TonB-dependent receptor plug domain-containing protein [Spirochaetia bacterium]